MFYPFINSNFLLCNFYIAPIYHQNSPIQPPIIENSLNEENNFNTENQVQREIREIESDSQILTDYIDLTEEDLRKTDYEKTRTTWSEEQDEKLMKLIRSNLKWEAIASQMEKRNIKMCYSRYKRLLANQSSSNKIRYWSKEQDQKLIQLIQLQGFNWKKLSSHFQGRLPKQLRERYINFLKPNITKTSWSIQQDLQLINLYNSYGKKWKIIADTITKRSQNQVKNRFYGKLLLLYYKKRHNLPLK